ncbi:MAG TPA: ribosome biogenesis GTPase YlqF [Candidatus Fimenecus excrementigallinarum]|uniref:Ribosome biogenesis GTPase A n=1 Tax=Candidatus Fimenecus excrementigallinarum TaxID=2840816 RepID=A0A9D1LE39_9FIRM|nr:ribosome biogenesis GTPase YlqF [Candidatus Fimenecus excrementigallinarum]
MADSVKQTVQWFPGHMAKTRRLLRECLPQVDAVVEVLDARVPESSRNPELSELTAGKPRIVLLNKCDLADEAATKAWLAVFRSRGFSALAVDCRSGKGLKQFVPLLKEVLSDRIAKNTQRGMAGKPLRCMVVGIPNTGKSSFINKMAGRARAEVADRAGVTRQNRWFAVGGGVELLDTPGVLWPKFDDPRVGDKLAFIGSVKDTVVDTQTLAVRLLEVLQASYPDRLRDRYKLEDFAEEPAYMLLERVGKKRGMLLRGGEIDCERAAAVLLDEYRAGLLGRLTLDKAGE